MWLLDGLWIRDGLVKRDVVAVEVRSILRPETGPASSAIFQTPR
jgi:hypothetical protein